MRKITFLFICITILCMVWTTPAQAETGVTILVSRSSSGVIGNDDSEYPSISADGRYVAFDSLSTNLSDLDNNIDKRDVFVKDLFTGEITLISRNATTGKAGNNHSAKPAISADGRFTAFESLATNLDSTCNNGYSHIFVHDQETQSITCVSINKSGTGTIIQGNGNSNRASISADGIFIAFMSEATKLVDGDTNGVADIFVHDCDHGETKLVSKSWDGSPADEFSYGAAISGSGRFIAYTSMASNLVEGFSDTAPLDVYVFDQQDQSTSIVSLNNSGVPGDHNSEYPSLSHSGRYIVFESFAENLVSNDTNGKKDIFMRDTFLDKTIKISIAITGPNANDHSYRPVISADGKFVSYESLASNLISDFVNPIRDIFLYEIQTGETSLVSVDSDNGRSTHDCFSPTISANGRYVAFSSEVSYFAVGDTNNASDIFRRETQSMSSIYLPLILR